MDSCTSLGCCSGHHCTGRNPNSDRRKIQGSGFSDQPAFLVTKVDVDFMLCSFCWSWGRAYAPQLCREGYGRTRTVGRWNFPRRVVNMDIYGEYLVLNIFVEVWWHEINGMYVKCKTFFVSACVYLMKPHIKIMEISNTAKRFLGSLYNPFLLVLSNPSCPQFTSSSKHILEFHINRIIYFVESGDSGTFHQP